MIEMGGSFGRLAHWGLTTFFLSSEFERIDKFSYVLVAQVVLMDFTYCNASSSLQMCTGLQVSLLDKDLILNVPVNEETYKKQV
jgi:hypothetical protein